MRRLKVGLLALAIAIACSDPSGPTPPPPVPTSQLHFVLRDTTAPPLFRDTASFYAMAGEDREVRLYYQGATPADTGEEYLRFEVRNGALYRKPDGSAFAPGDSIHISIRVLDRRKFLFEFQPTGLQFSPSEPSRLKIQYSHADHDFDGDGRLTPSDTVIQRKLDIWQRTPPDTLWTKLSALNVESLEELEGKIYHFTDHAIAW
jgi:hypothetical protein